MQWLCGSVGRVVASDTRGPRFESSHWQKLFILNICVLSTVCIEKDENKEKRPGMAHFLKKSYFKHSLVLDWPVDQ